MRPNPRRRHSHNPERRTTVPFRIASHTVLIEVKTMIRPALLPSCTFLAAALAFSGCSHNGHPDDKMAVYNALDQNYLRSLTVSQDRHAGTITLSGVVGSPDRSQKAEQVAQQAAPATPSSITFRWTMRDCRTK